MAQKSGKKLRFPRTRKLISLFSDFIKRFFSPVSKIVNNIITDYSEQSALKKTFIGLFQLRYMILFSLLFVMLCAGYFFAAHNDREASVIMSMNYEESSKGLNPNSTRFNIYEIKSQEVVEKMLYYCGIDAKSVDVDKIIDSISVNPTNSKAFKVDDYYIATSYRITLKKPSQIKGVSANDLITFLCKSYTDLFYQRYADNRSVLTFDVKDFDGVEFLLTADLMQLKAQEQSKYLSTRAKQSKTFTEGNSNETFKSLYEKLEDFQNYDIARYRSFILQTGIAHDKAHLIKMLNYVNLVNSVKYEKDMASYKANYDGVAMYNEALVNIMLIPTVDRTQGNYYMSKTETGMDYLARQADKSLNAAEAGAKKIETNNNTITKLEAGENRSEDIEKANKMIADMQTKFDEIGRQIEILDKAYVKYKTKDYITFQMKGMSLKQKVRVDLLVELAILLIAAAFAALWIKFRYFGGGVKK